MTLRISTLSLMLLFLVSGITAQSSESIKKRKYQVSLMVGKTFSMSYKEKILSQGEEFTTNHNVKFGSETSNALVLLIHKNVNDLWQLGAGYGLERFDITGNSMPLFIDVRRGFLKNGRKSIFAYGSAGILIQGDTFNEGLLLNLGAGLVPKTGKRNRWSVLLGMEYRKVNVNFITSDIERFGHHLGVKLNVSHTF